MYDYTLSFDNSTLHISLAAAMKILPFAMQLQAHRAPMPFMGDPGFNTAGILYRYLKP